MAMAATTQTHVDLQTLSCISQMLLNHTALSLPLYILIFCLCLYPRVTCTTIVYALPHIPLYHIASYYTTLKFCTIIIPHFEVCCCKHIIYPHLHNWKAAWAPPFFVLRGLHPFVLCCSVGSTLFVGEGGCGSGFFLV